MFQSVARRREALEMLEKARRLDPLELRLDVLKATYLEWGPGDYAEADRTLQAVLERDPLFVPALVRLADIRWGGQGRHAESVALLEQAVALDPGNETAWRHLVLSYISVGEIAASDGRDWPRLGSPGARTDEHSLVPERMAQAGEAAYALMAAGPTYFQIEVAGFARNTPARARDRRLSARHQGARKLGVRLGMATSRSWKDSSTWRSGVAGLADMLMANGPTREGAYSPERAARQCRPAGRSASGVGSAVAQ